MLWNTGTLEHVPATKQTPRYLTDVTNFNSQRDKESDAQAIEATSNPCTSSHNHRLATIKLKIKTTANLSQMSNIIRVALRERNRRTMSSA